MGPYLTIATEAKPLVTAACSLPNPASGKINYYTTVQGLYKSFIEEVNAGRITLPCVVADFGDFNPDTEFGLEATNKIMPAAFHYIAQIAGTNGTQDGVSAAAIAIGLAFDVGHPATIQVIEPSTVQSNVDSPILAALAAKSKPGIISATVSWSPGWRTTLIVS